MIVCNNKHDPIVYRKNHRGEDTGCPLCRLTKHDNQVHDFIESKGKELVKELVAYLESHE